MTFEKHRNANGTYDGAGVMGEVTGLSRSEIAGILGEVKANLAKLNDCAYHEFEPNPDPSVSATMNRHRMYICKNCGGTVSEDKHRWHELGRRPKP